MTKGLTLNHQHQQQYQQQQGQAGRFSRRVEMDKDVLNFALNRSYIKQMADDKHKLTIDELIDTVGDFIATFIPRINLNKELE